jgi:hypothetical protein
MGSFRLESIATVTFGLSLDQRNIYSENCEETKVVECNGDDWIAYIQNASLSQ